MASSEKPPEDQQPASPPPAADAGPTSEAPPAREPAEGERPARPAPTARGEAATAPPRPARPAPARGPAAAPPPPDPKALEHPVTKALTPPGGDLQPRIVHGYLELTLPADQLLAAARRLRDEFDFDYLSQVTAVDWPDHFELVYTLYHVRRWQEHKAADPDGPQGLILRVHLPREEAPRVRSVMSVWPGAELQEREVYDMFGIRFLGHPDLRRVLLEDDFPGFPLRKDFTIDPEYVLVRHLAHGSVGQLGERVDAGDRPV
jgi:NADH:ubiquinone oxidoreductase subunit C